MSQVTGLQVITNLYRSTIKFYNTEYPGNNRTIRTTNSVDPGNAWIPWCDSEDSFSDHHMTLKAEDGSLTFYFWQSGSNIWYSTTGWSDNANSLYPQVGLSVSLVILSSGDLIMSSHT